MSYVVYKSIAEDCPGLLAMPLWARVDHVATYQTLSEDRCRYTWDPPLCTYLILGIFHQRTPRSWTTMETMLHREDEMVVLQVIYDSVADYPFHRFAYNWHQAYQWIIASDLTPALSRCQSSTHLAPPQ